MNQNNRPLLQAEHLINHAASAVRQALTWNLKNLRARVDWMNVSTLRAVDFETELGSAINRLTRFLGPNLLRSMFGVSSVSFDFRDVIDKGTIVFVALATEAGKVADDHGHLVGSLLIHDLWQAARQRGKRAGLKQVSIFLDEFQHFLSPQIANNLNEALGFGLRFTLSHQFPNQLLPNEFGKEVLDAIFANVSRKITFALEGEEDLRRLSLPLYGLDIRGDKVKHETWSTKVVGYEEEWKTIYSASSSTGWGKNSTSGYSAGAGLGGTKTFNGEEPLFSFNEVPLSVSESHSKFQAKSGSDGISSAGSESIGSTDLPFQKPIFGKEQSGVHFWGIEEQIYAGMAAVQALPKRHFLIRLPGAKGPTIVRTRTIPSVPNDSKNVERYRVKLMRRFPFMMKAAEAQRQLKAHEEELVNLVQANQEATTTRRRIK